MSRVTVVRGVGLPPAVETRGQKGNARRERCPPTRYPWDELNVGDAFDVEIPVGPPPPSDRYPEYNRLSATVSTRHKRHPERYVVRMMPDFRVRCWRVK